MYDSAGYLVRNVGGDENVPHRSTDPDTKSFLDGVLEKRQRFEALATWEPVNQIWLEMHILREVTIPAAAENLTVGSLRLRVEF